jgi:hypothetical protein
VTGRPPPLDAACAGLSAAACAACRATPRPTACVACAIDPRVSPKRAELLLLLAPGAAAGSTGNTALDQCATCAAVGDAAGRSA